MSIVSIMQFSDLHKSATDSENDNALISSIISDINRQNSEQPKIQKPKILVVCGDVIQGCPMGLSYEDSLQEIFRQYEQANNILNQLCEKLLDGDKKRVIIVPGNHDISWPHSMNSMVKLETPIPVRQRYGRRSYSKKTMKKLGTPVLVRQYHDGRSRSKKTVKKLETVVKGYVNLLKNPLNNIRWNWNDLSFYQITDEDEYNNRFIPFSNFYNTFYEKTRKYSLIPKDQFDIFEIPEYNLLFFGLNSCYRNDHLNDLGLFNQDCVASCHDIITKNKNYEDWLKIAVWHHGTYGGPSRSDYLDQGRIQFLMDKGIQIGLHGHQHKAEIIDMKFIVDESLHLPILGCGTLCASDRDIPPGETRQYNIIELEREYSSLTLHTRKSYDQAPGCPIWMAESIRHNINDPFVKLFYGKMKKSSPVEVRESDMDKQTGLSKELTQIDYFISNRNFIDALDKLKDLDSTNPFVRSFLIECLASLERDDQLIAFLTEPRDIREFTYLSEALWKKKDLDGLKRILEMVSMNPEIVKSESYMRMTKKIQDRG